MTLWTIQSVEFLRPKHWGGVGSWPLPWGIVPIQGLNPSLHCKQILHCQTVCLNYFFKDPVSKVGGMKTSRYRFGAGRYIQSIIVFCFLNAQYFLPISKKLFPNRSLGSWAVKPLRQPPATEQQTKIYSEDHGTPCLQVTLPCFLEKPR